MKWLAIVTGVLLTLLIGIYTLLFTSLGNTIVAPILQNKINETLALDTLLERFELDSDSFTIELRLTPNNAITVAGNYTLFTQQLNAAYRLRLNNLQELASLTKTTLHGKLHTEGSVTGRLDALSIEGRSDIAQSQTRYSLKLNDFTAHGLNVKMNDAKVEALLAMIGQKPYTTAQLDIDLDFISIDPKQLDGNAVITLVKGDVNEALMQEDFNLSLPRTTYATKAVAKLKGDTISYSAKLESNLAYIFSQGNVSPEPLATDLEYELNIQELALFRPLTHAPLRGPLSTKGTLVGSQDAITLKGTSDIANSETGYDLLFQAFKPKKVIATIKNASLQKLLYLAGEPGYADGKINAEITLNDLDPKNLNGEATVKLSRGSINSAVMKNAYGITVPQTDFTYELETTLEGKEIDYTTYFNSNIAEINSRGKVTPESMGLDLDYHVAIDRLELLKPLTDLPLRGPVNLDGTLKGDKEQLILKGQSDIAKSDTSYKVELAKFAPKTVHASIKRLQLKSLLYLISQPDYANALVDMNIDITDARQGKLDGTITTLLSRGSLNNPVVEKSFEFGKMPRVTFRGNMTSQLQGNVISSSGEVISSLADFTLKSADIDLKQSTTHATYLAKIHNLEHLYFATERHLKGAMELTGDLTKGNDLDLNLHSDTLGGRIDANLHNDDLKAELKNIQTIDALHMLIYPEVFQSLLNGDFKYNLKSQQGRFDAKLSDGKFTRNTMLDLARQYGRVDLYKERFKGTITSKINKELIYSDMVLNSNSSSITTKKAKLNSKTKIVDAKIHIDANNNPLDVTLRGNVSKPQVKIDAGKIIEKEASEQLDKLFKKLF